MSNKEKILDEPEVKEQIHHTIYRGVIAKTKEFLINHILPKLSTLIMYDIIDATFSFLNEKGFINDKMELSTNYLME